MPRMDEMTRNIFSIEEKRVSTLIVAFLFFCGIAAYLAIESGDIPPNLVNVLLGLITAIAGVNAVDSWVNKGRRGTNNEDWSQGGPGI